MKYVKEILYEKNNLKNYLQFKEDSDPIEDMKIGAKTLINNWLNLMDIKSYKLTKRNSINVYSYVLLDNKNLDNIPSYIKFNHIMGGFHINDNQITSLKGCPYSVSGSFMASINKLSSLTYGPSVVKECYGVSFNKLNSLLGISEIIGLHLYLNNNNLKNLKYIPRVILGDLVIHNNPIETIDYFPEIIHGNLTYTPSQFLNKKTILNICDVKGHLIEKS